MQSRVMKTKATQGIVDQKARQGHEGDGRVKCEAKQRKAYQTTERQSKSQQTFSPLTFLVYVSRLWTIVLIKYILLS